MGELAKLTIATARDMLRAKTISATELTNDCLSAIDAGDALNAFCHKTPDHAREQAITADKMLATGDAPDMCGIPLGIKDLFCTKGVKTQAASAILANFKPEYESTITTQLWQQGAIMLGKTNMDEFAMGSSNETSTYGAVINPWRGGDPAPLTPGGSVWRLCRRRCRRFMLGGSWHGHGRFHPSTRCFHGYYGDKTHLRAMLALGGYRLCLVPRPSRTHGKIRARLRDITGCNVGA